MAAAKVVGFLLLLVIAAQYTGWTILDQAAVALVALLVVTFLWSRSSLGGIGFERRLTSDRVAVGEELQETLTLTNGSRLPKLWLEVWDFSTLPGYRANRVMQIGGQSSRSWAVAQICSARGMYRMGPITIRSGDPLGLFPRWRSIPVAHDVLVFPATVDATEFRVPTSSLSGGRMMTGKHPLQTSTVAGVRDYDAGDPLNRVSWTATARSGRLMTKEFDLDPTSDVWIVLDLDQAQHVTERYPRGHPAYRQPVAPWLDSTEEYAVTAAASLAKRCLDEGRVVGMIATGNHLEVLTPDRSERQYVRVLESLALVRADGAMPLAECLTMEARRFRRQSVVIVVTGSASDEWVPPLARLMTRGISTSVVLVDQETFGPAPSPLLAVSALTAAEIPVVLVKHGEELGAALESGPPDAASRRERYVHG